MKLLAFSDLHADFAVLKKLIARAQQPDIALLACAGDFTVFGSFMAEILGKLDVLGKPVLLIPGNHEEPEKVRQTAKNTKNVIYLHEQLLRRDGITFLGWGTDGFSRHSGAFRSAARSWRRHLTEEDGIIILVTHAPPYKTKLDALDGSSVGNADIRREIERIRPRLAISGHIHENAGTQDRIGSTIIINPGWNGMVVEI